MGEDFRGFIQKQEQQRRPWLFTEKAKGEGRGYHSPHLGRPGKVGGSRPRGGRASSGEHTRKTLQHIVDRLAKQYKMPKTRINVSEGKSSESPAWLGLKNEIYVDLELAEAYEKAVQEGLFESDSIAENVEEILMHEYGEFIHSELIFNPDYAHFGLGGTAASRRAAGFTWEESLTNKLANEIPRTHGQKLSSYAASDGDEYFAEAFIAYNRSGNWRSKIHPEILSVFRELDGRL